MSMSTLPQQSPNWDDEMPLCEMLEKGKYFILLHDDSYGDLVKVILSESTKNGILHYEYRTLGHDRHGVTCEAEGSMQAAFLGAQIEAGQVDLAQDPTEALKHIGRILTKSNRRFS